jgi:thioredoxin 2
VRTSRISCERCGLPNRLPAAGPGMPVCGRCRCPLPWITDADDNDFADVVTGSALTVLVNIWAPWCPVCWRARPALERLARQLAGQIKLVHVDITRAPALRWRLVVESVPTLLVMHGPVVAARQAGAPPEPSLRTWLDQAVCERRGGWPLRSVSGATGRHGPIPRCAPR